MDYWKNICRKLHENLPCQVRDNTNNNLFYCNATSVIFEKRIKTFEHNKTAKPTTFMDNEGREILLAFGNLGESCLAIFLYSYCVDRKFFKRTIIKVKQEFYGLFPHHRVDCS